MSRFSKKNTGRASRKRPVKTRTPRPSRAPRMPRAPREPGEPGDFKKKMIFFGFACLAGLYIFWHTYGSFDPILNLMGIDTTEEVAEEDEPAVTSGNKTVAALALEALGLQKEQAPTRANKAQVVYYAKVRENTPMLKEKSPNATVLTTIPAGAAAAIARVENKEWLYVRYARFTGWVHKSQVADYVDAYGRPLKKKSQ